MDPKAEWLPGRAGVDGEHLVTVRIVGLSLRWLQATTAQFSREVIRRAEIVHMKVQVDLLLLRSRRPLRLRAIGGVLDAQHPLAINHTLCHASSRCTTPPRRPAQNLLSLSMSLASMTMTRRTIFTLTSRSSRRCEVSQVRHTSGTLAATTSPGHPQLAILS